MLMGAALAGLTAGAIHATTGPDHLAVVAPLAARGSGHGWRIGVRWGLGHALGVGLVGLCALAFREVLPLGAVESWSERLVGGSLVIVGVWVLTAALRKDRRRHAEAGENGVAALAVGALHGTAGGSHLVGVLPALALSSSSAAAAYVLAFATGTVGSMAAFAGVVAAGSRGSRGVSPVLREGFVGVCALASIVVGLVWLGR